MPREIRTLKRSFFLDEKLASLPRPVRLTFMGLIPNADDYGRLQADPRLLRAAIYPLDEDITAADIEHELTLLEQCGRIVRYQVNGNKYLEIKNFGRHQVMARKYSSDIPAPPDAPSTQCVDSARADREHSRSGEGEEKERSGAERSARARDLTSGTIPEDPDPFGVQEAATAPPAPLLSLPPMAERLVEQVYGLATEKRRLDVRRQLCETIAPVGRGARIRNGVYVKARSTEHLDMVCRAVLDDLPRDVDAAIVFVLRKLQDAPPGPSPTEVAAQDEAKRVALEEAYQTELRAAGLEWAKTNPEDFKRMRQPIDAQFGDPANAFARMARDAALAQAAGRAAGFPTFDLWRHGEHATAGAA